MSGLTLFQEKYQTIQFTECSCGRTKTIVHCNNTVRVHTFNAWNLRSIWSCEQNVTTFIHDPLYFTFVLDNVRYQCQQSCFFDDVFEVPESYTLVYQVILFKQQKQIHIISNISLRNRPFLSNTQTEPNPMSKIIEK